MSSDSIFYQICKEVSLSAPSRNIASMHALGSYFFLSPEKARDCDMVISLMSEFGSANEVRTALFEFSETFRYRHGIPIHITILKPSELIDFYGSLSSPPPRFKFFHDPNFCWYSYK